MRRHEVMALTLVKTRIWVTGEQMSLLDTASKLLGFLRWSGEKYSTSSDIRAHPAQVYLSQYLHADCSTLGQACSTGSCSTALHMCRNRINTAQGVCTGWSLSVLHECVSPGHWSMALYLSSAAPQCSGGSRPYPCHTVSLQTGCPSLPSPALLC